MSRGQRLLLLLAVAVVAVVGFAVASPGGEDDDGDSDRVAKTTTTGPKDTPRETTPTPPPEPAVERIRIRQGTVVGGPKRIVAEKGDTVRIVVRVDVADEIHLHGYDITRNAQPERPARFRFEAGIEGDFEIESHVAADAGRDPLIARLVVEPA